MITKEQLTELLVNHPITTQLLMKHIDDSILQKVTDDPQFLRYSKRVLVRNMAQCNKCDDIIESVNSEVKCKCGAVTLRGGTKYVEYEVDDLSNYSDVSEYKYEGW